MNLASFLSIFRHRSFRSIRKRRWPFDFEQLDARNLLAVYVVTSADDLQNDDGMTSLREAIQAANSTHEADTVQFSEALQGATIVLENGEFDIDRSLTIEGPGADLLTIDATGNDPTPHEARGDGTRIFDVEERDFTISGLTLTGGDSKLSGGAIFVGEGGRLTILDSVVEGNHSLRNGGAIRSDGDATLIRNSTIRDNHARGDGGGVFAGYELRIVESTITGNTSGRDGGGVFSNVDEFNSEVTRTAFEGNWAYGRGGGMFVDDVRSRGSGWTGITDSTFNGNNAYHGGGFAGQGQIRMDRTTITGNNAVNPLGTFLAGNGGGVLLTGSSFAIINNSTISGNYALANGGGFFVDLRDNYNTLSLSNSTVSSNAASYLGGAVSTSNPANNARSLGNITISNSTLVDSHDERSPGIAAPFEMLYFDHSIVAFHAPTDFVNLSSADIIGAEHSFFGDNSMGLEPAPIGMPDADGNFLGTVESPLDPLLDELADNGGPTATHAPLPNSPVIDAGNPEYAYRLYIDQRGMPYSRISGAAIDIGGFEMQAIPGDFEHDNQLDCADLNKLSAEIPSIVDPTSEFDMNHDGHVDTGDVDEWLAFAGSMNLPSGNAYPRGDANLDGRVNSTDLNIVGTNWRQETTAYCAGDFDGDGHVTSSDLNAIGLNWQVDVSGRDLAAAGRVPRAALAARVPTVVVQADGRRHLEDQSAEKSMSTHLVPTELTEATLHPFERHVSRFGRFTSRLHSKSSALDRRGLLQDTRSTDRAFEAFDVGWPNL